MAKRGPRQTDRVRELSRSDVYVIHAWMDPMARSRQRIHEPAELWCVACPIRDDHAAWAGTRLRM